MRVEFLHGGAAAEFDAAAFVDHEAFDPHFVADLADVFNRTDAGVGKFGDVAEAVFAGDDFDEGAEFFDAGDGAFVDLAFFGFGGDGGDFADGDFEGFGVVGEDLDDAKAVGFFDVDLGAGEFGDAADVFAAGADEFADLVAGDFDGVNAGGVFGEFGAGFGKDGFHEVENVHAAFAGAGEGFLNEVPGEAADFEVDLEAGDAVAGAGDFEVHVAAVVFAAEDVGDEEFFAGGGEEADGDAGNGGFDGDAGIHEGEGADADGGHGGGTVGAHDVGDDANGVLVVVRDDGFKGAFGKGAVTDFAATETADATDFAHAVGGEVVVEHELFGFFAAGDGVHVLGVGFGAEGDATEGLGFAACEDGGTVGAGHDAELGGEGTNGVHVAAVNALGKVGDVFANEFDFDEVEEFDEGGGGGLGPFFGEGGEHVGLDGVDLALTIELAGDEECEAEFFAGEVAEELQFFGVGVAFGDDFFGLAEHAAKFVLGVDDFDDFGVAEFHGGEEVGFGDLFGAAFHHEEAVAQAGVDEVEVAFFALGLSGVDDELAVDAADADATDGTHEGNVGDVKRGGGGVDGENVGLVHAVGGEEHDVDLHIIEVAVGEEGTDGAVGDARAENFFFAGALFALEITAGETAGRVILLAVFDLKRKIVDAFARRVGVRGGRENHGFAERDGGRARGLHGEQAGFDGEGLSADVDGHLGGVVHGSLPRGRAGRKSGSQKDEAAEDGPDRDRRPGNGKALN